MRSELSIIPDLLAGLSKNVWMIRNTDLLPAFRSQFLDVPVDLGLLRLWDAFKEGGVVLNSK